MLPLTVVREPGRFWAVVGIACIVTMAGIGCSGDQSPSPTPDPFIGYADRANDALFEGTRLYDEGRYREALDQLERARLLSPTRDPRIEGMLLRARSMLTPSPTPASIPEANPGATLGATPATELASNYFGQVFLTVVPGANSVPLPMSQFFYKDQLALFIEKLDQRLRLPFVLRILGDQHVVSEVRSDASGFQPARFGDKLVWYHQGGEAPGQYRLDLYAGDVLAYEFDYVVGREPIPLPTTAPTQIPSPTPVPLVEPTVPPIPSLSPAPLRIDTPVPRVVAIPAPALPTATPAPVAVRTIKMATPPLVLDVERSSTRTYVADSSGLIWTLEDGQPTLQPPINVGGQPAGLAIDERLGRLYIGVRSPAAILVVDAANGQRIGSLALPIAPGEVRLDAELSLLYVLLPEAQALAAIHTNPLTIQYVQGQLVEVSGIALDSESHTLYLSHQNGELSIINGQAPVTIDRLRLTDVGLTGVATALGQVYGINTPGRELVVLDPALREAAHVALSDEPLAVSASQSNGDIYILTGQSDAVVRINPVNGREVARAELQGGSSGPVRMAISQVGETVYVAPSTQNVLAVLSAETFGLLR